jgi:hypothetical protein
MPFTFAHPAIVLPLAGVSKKYVSLTGLIVGSVTPDFEYFLRTKVLSIYSHTWIGILWFDLPLALMLCFLYHIYVRDALIDNLPLFLSSRLAKYKMVNWQNYISIHKVPLVTSVIIGCASHLFWDSFTHQSGYFVQLNNMTRLINIGNMALPLFKIVQYTSTLVGGIIVLTTLLRLPKQERAVNSQNVWYWPVIVASIFLLIAVKVIFGFNIRHYFDVFVTIISGLILGCLLAPFVIKAVTNKKAVTNG